MPTTHLLYLHGFRSSPASTKARMTVQAVMQHYPKTIVLCPALATSPKLAMAEVVELVKDWPRESMALVGSSLGGFYATYLAQWWGCKAVLLNPAVHPARDLAAHLGEQSVWHDPTSHLVFERSYLAELGALEVQCITQPDRYFAVIAKGDEVLDWQEMTGHYPGARIKLLPSSDHALSDYAQHIDQVMHFLFKG